MTVSSVRGALRSAVLVSVVTLLVVVAAVGAVALIAELNGTWIWYRRMEKVVAATAEPALVLAALAVVAMFGAVLVADR